MNKIINSVKDFWGQKRSKTFKILTAVSIFLVIVIAMIVVGVMMLALQNIQAALWVKSKTTASLALGAVTMTVECGVRFLTDYLNGDKYFRIHYPTQNLARANCHLALALDMIKKLPVMEEIVGKYSS